MSNGNFQSLIEKISRSSGLKEEEIAEKINLKQQKISGMISREGAAQIIAAELGVSLENEKSKIIEIVPGMRRVNVVGNVINISPVRSFVRNGQASKVANIVIADDTSNIKVVLWDANHIELIETGKISVGTSVEISNGSTRGNEIHLGSFSEFRQSSETFSSLMTKKVFKEKNISDFEISDNAKTRAFVVQVFEPKFFNVCGECKKSVVSEADGFVCKEHGKVVPERRALMNIVLDDGTETIRTVLFHEKLGQMGVSADGEFSAQKKQEILGKEMIFYGNVKTNKFFNNPEFVIEEVEEINVDEILNRLENEK